MFEERAEPGFRNPEALEIAFDDAGPGPKERQNERRSEKKAESES
ncbi:hypothetical protein [Nisaea nitritireducens]|nr:hypothetical protein [Nisaea nitritireducens]